MAASFAGAATRPRRPCSIELTIITEFAFGERCPVGTRFGRLRIISCTRPSGQSQCAIKIAAFGLSYPIMRRRTDLEEKHDSRGGRTIVNRHSSFREIPERGIDPETAIREGDYV